MLRGRSSAHDQRHYYPGVLEKISKSKNQNQNLPTLCPSPLHVQDRAERSPYKKEASSKQGEKKEKKRV
jgi:hypothetical protein